ncbi:anti-sigma factor antagonist [Comamonas testosteroni]|uniref:Anti-sigma factor antagonist n=1 Tax=Comamonas testosteroni TaxID=285 RepID=A0A373FP14_COMTE|nr:STAS domain-containing protein [Comamonas testosteroni]RGE45667.1 anti-sigma factor antagonist [Comamonas testosteroni]
MTIAIEPNEKAHIIALQGQVNSSNAATVETEVLDVVQKGARNVLLNMTELSYISSAGLRVVLVLAKRLKQAGGKLVIYGMQPHVREVFDVSGFLAILNVTATRAEALEQF